MSSSTTCGRSARASSMAAWPSWTTLTWWRQRRSRLARLSAASTLSSTTSTRRLPSPPAGPCTATGSGALGAQRQAHHELAPLAESAAVDLDAAAVHLDQAAHQREPDAEATFDARQRVVALDEGLEDVGEPVGRDAD